MNREEIEQECEELKKELVNGGGTLTDKIRAAVFTDLQRENEYCKQALKEIAKITNNISNYMNTGCNMDRCEECNHAKPYCINQCVCYLIQQGKSIVDIVKEIDKCV